MLLLEDTEGFLDNRHLRLVEMENDILFEAEIRGSMNSVELSIDEMYMDINFRACLVSKTEYYNFSSTFKGKSGSS